MENRVSLLNSDGFSTSTNFEDQNKQKYASTFILNTPRYWKFSSLRPFVLLVSVIFRRGAYNLNTGSYVKIDGFATFEVLTAVLKENQDVQNKKLCLPGKYLPIWRDLLPPSSGYKDFKKNVTALNMDATKFW
jgi:hypothetical protein